MIIRKTSPLAELLIRESQLRKLHSGPQMTFFALRQTVWIPGGIASVKKVIHNCKPCIRFDARIRQPLMGDLPAKRILELFAFQFTGMDYCEPFYTKDFTETAKIIRSYIHLFHHKGDTLGASGKSNQRRLKRYPQEIHRKTRYFPSNLQ